MKPRKPNPKSSLSAKPACEMYECSPKSDQATKTLRVLTREAFVAQANAHEPASEPYILIGVDSEFVNPRAPSDLTSVKSGQAKNKPISYQFHCITSSGEEWNGIVCPSDRQRISLGDLIVFALAKGVAEGHAKHPLPTKVYLAGHFTRADLPAFSDFATIQSMIGNIRNTFSSIDQAIRLRIVFPEDPLELKVILRDTFLLSPGGSGSKSLAAIGDLVGVPKVVLHEDPARERELKRSIWTLRDSYWDLFSRYAVTDATICARYLQRLISLYESVTGKFKVPTTLSGIGVDLTFKAWEQKGWDSLEILGNEVVTEKHWSNRRNRYIRSNVRVPTEICHLHATLATEAFHGGRNEQFWFGPSYPASWTDYDLTSAYPTAMSLIGMPRWSELRHSKILNEYTPTTLGFALVEFRFPKSTRYPTLPVRTANGLLFPLQGRSYCAAPEIALARSLGAKLRIIEGTIVPTDPDQRVFQEFIKGCLDQRNQHPKNTLENLFWKEIANSTYGKTAQGLKKKRVYDLRERGTRLLPESRLTNPYFAAYITSFVRAVLGEIMNGIPEHRMVFSCTTDGFITDATPEDMANATCGPLCNIYRKARNDLTGKEALLEIKHEARMLLGWTTRGQATLDPGPHCPEDPSRSIVLAKGGIHIPEEHASVGDDNAYIVDLFLNRYPDQLVQVTTLTGVRDIVEHGADLVPKTFFKKLSMEYDWKRRPLAVGMHATSNHLLFSTEPWTSVREFRDVRDLWSDYKKAKPTCLKTREDYERFAAYADTKLAIKGMKGTVATETPDLTRLRIMLCAAWRRSQAGLRWEPGGATRFARILTQAGIPAQRHDVEYGKRILFLPNSCPGTQCCKDAIKRLKATFPDLRESELFSPSEGLLSTDPLIKCRFVSQACASRPPMIQKSGLITTHVPGRPMGIRKIA